MPSLPPSRQTAIDFIAGVLFIVFQGLTMIAVVCLFPPLYGTIYDGVTQANFMGTAFPYEETSNPASQLLELSNSLFQLSVALVAGVWGVVVLEKGDSLGIKKHLHQLWTMVFASVALGASCLHHLLYVHQLVGLEYLAQTEKVTPDLNHTLYLEHLIGQESGLVLAAILVVCAVVRGILISRRELSL